MWGPFFGLQLMSPLGFKARVGSFIHTWWRFHEIRLWCDTCWPLGSKHDSWAILFHVTCQQTLVEFKTWIYGATDQSTTDWFFLSVQKSFSNQLKFKYEPTLKTCEEHVRKCPVDTNVNYNSQQLTYYGFLWPSRWNGKKRIYKNRPPLSI